MAFWAKHVARDGDRSLKTLGTSFHISCSHVMGTALDKFKGHESSVNGIQRNTRDDQLSDANGGRWI